MRKSIIGGMLGVFLGAGVLLFMTVACGGGGGGGSVLQTILNAVDVVFDNSTSGMAAEDVQAGIDELDGRLDVVVGDVTDLNDRSDLLGDDHTMLADRVTTLEAKGQVIASRSPSLGTNLNDVYVVYVSSSSRIGAEILLPRNGSISEFKCRSLSAPVAGTTITATLHINGSDVGIPLAFTDADGEVLKSATATIDVSAGDLFTFRFVSSSSSSSGGFLAAATYR